ncbi:protein FAM151A-like [Mytilus californianus]|uniref:protein FAM151A-like n=1 Tax=Mytilus californianus TaxID=6549 RepID=UPI002245E674|nr:protein FAM151A-like [Mytilus californianus]
MSTKSSTKRVFLITVTLVILALFIAVIVLAVRKRECDNKGNDVHAPIVSVQNRYYILDNFKKDDGINIRWLPNVNSRTQIDTAISIGKYNMIEVIIQTASGNDLVIGGTDGIKLLDTIKLLSAAGIGIKINVKNNIEAEAVLSTLRKVLLDKPVLISIPILSPSTSFDLDRFKKDLSALQVMDNYIGINLFISKTFCDLYGIEYGTSEYISDLIKNLAFPVTKVTVEMEVDTVQSSWKGIKWILDTNPSVKLIISSNSLRFNVTSFDLLLLRNDADKDKLLYNIDEAMFQDFVDVSSTAGSPLLYFNIAPRDASGILWSHNTDTWHLLNTATQGNVMMIEGDIMLLGQDTSNKTNIPIMAHDVGDYNNITFEQWIDEIIKVDKGMKLDLKTIDAVKPTLQIVSKKSPRIKGPVWANADILKGPDGTDPRIPADAFLEAIREFPNVVLSLGWTTKRKGDNYNLNYTMEMVQEMYNIVKDLEQPITFPVRAEQLINSLDSFEWLLGKSRGYTLTVWTAHNDNVTKADMDFARRKLEASRIYFDLPRELRPTFV